jgi:hypothetical protein
MATLMIDDPTAILRLLSASPKNEIGLLVGC